MPRSMWTGTVTFGLVSIPVKMFTAVSKKTVSFHQLDDRTMARIKYQKISAADGSEVPADHIIKGYEISQGNYVTVDPVELESFLATPTKLFEIDQFIRAEEIDPIYFDSSYYLAPDAMAKPYMLLAKAMEQEGKVGIGRFVMRGKQHLGALRSVEGHLVLSTLVYEDEVISPSIIEEFSSLDTVEINEKELNMATQLVDSLASDFDMSIYKDTYREQVLDLIEKKAAGEELSRPEVADAPAKVVDLMAALEASVKAAQEARKHASEDFDVRSRRSA
jgi:DNA end-binding protein Ku